MEDSAEEPVFWFKKLLEVPSKKILIISQPKFPSHITLLRPKNLTYPVHIKGLFLTLFISKVFNCSLLFTSNLDHKGNNNFVYFYLLNITFRAHFLSC